MDKHFPILDVAALTDRGRKRERNEDFLNLVIPPPNSAQEKMGALFVVADGMGGMGGGDVASRTAVEEIMRTFYAPDDGQVPFERLRVALEAANEAVRSRAQEVNLTRIGSTAAGMLLDVSGEVVLFNVGDSRVYRLRGDLIEQLTHDQSVVQAQIDAGQITEEQARQGRNVNVTSFIGQPMPLSPVYRRAQIQPGDVFIICSDGLWDLAEPREIAQIVRKNPAQSAVRKLVELALERGAPDNVSVIVARIGPPPRRSLWRYWPAAAGLIAVVGLALAAVWLATRDGDSQTDGGELAAAGPAVTATASSTPTATPALADTTEPGISIISPTPSLTATPSPTQPTATYTPTEKPSATPTATRTRTNTPTVTTSPTDTTTPTATRTASPTPTATRTASPTTTPSLTATATRTPVPSDTPRPTSTLDANVITYTPSPTPTLTATYTPSPEPSPTPTLSLADITLILAAETGVTLTDEATLYLISSGQAGMPDQVEEVSLAESTHVRISSDEKRLAPNAAAGVLREVIVLDGSFALTGGWLLESVLADAVPAEPHVIIKNTIDEGANVRRGDGSNYPRVAVMWPGDTARILGISSRGTGWYAIMLPNGQQGWIAPGIVDTIGDISTLESITPPPPPPTYTPSPDTSSTPESPPDAPTGTEAPP